MRGRWGRNMQRGKLHAVIGSTLGSQLGGVDQCIIGNRDHSSLKARYGIQSFVFAFRRGTAALEQLSP
jgi:hypothetical protein